MRESYVKLGDAFRQRTFCAFHTLADEPGIVGKVARRARTKRYPIGLTVRYPLKLYTTVKYGIRDLVSYEYDLIRSFPLELKAFLPPGLKLTRSERGESVLCSGRVIDFDGTPSRFLNEVGASNDAFFWSEVQKIAEILRAHRLFMPNVLEAGSIVVWRVASDRAVPVLCPDVFKAGRALYPLQLHLLLRPVLQMKFERRFRRFLRRYSPDRG